MDGAENGAESENKPDNLELKEVLEKIDQLKDGETLHISHCFNISRVGGINIATDVVTEGDTKPWGSVIPPSGDSALKSHKEERDSQSEIIHASATSLDDQVKRNTQLVGEAIGTRVDAVVISHLDPDHMDFEAIRAMMESNKNLDVYGPLGWQGFIAKAHGFTANSGDESYLPEDIKKRMHSLDPKAANPQREKGLSYPGLNMSEAKIEKRNNRGELVGSATIKSFEVPHRGGAFVDYSAGYLLESGDTRIMHIADAALSPEVLRQVADLTKEKPLSQIYISTAAYNLSHPYPVSPKIWKFIRDSMMEESYAHSNFLPVALSAVTEGKTPIYLTHHGTYYDSQRTDIQKGGLDARLPFTDTQDGNMESWFSRFRAELESQTEAIDFKKLGPLTSSIGGSQGRTTVTELIKSISTRIGFTRKVTGWLENNKIPSGVKDVLHFPQANSIN